MSAPAVQSGQSLPVRDAALVDAARDGVVGTLMDGLLHDARNPLNALIIHLEVLTQKLRGEDGQVPASQEKSLRSMREQVARLDVLLQQFCTFLAPRPAGVGPVPLSEVVSGAVEVLAHESRRKRLKVRTAVDGGLMGRPVEQGAVRFLVVQSLLCAFRRAELGSEVGVRLRRAGGEALLEVEGSASEALEPAPDVLVVMEREASKVGARVQVRGGLCQVAFTLI